MITRTLLIVLLLSLVSCGQPSPDAGRSTEEPVINTGGPQNTDGIRWFDGSVEQAFAKASRNDTPLFLYWGAVWCPPCHELKATVFQEPSFVQASRQFIAVYLDGDTPGAQKHAEQFGVVGYPTLVVFNSSGEELTRIPNGLDLGAYASVLQYALNDLQPIGELVEGIVDASSAKLTLTVDQCRLLAQHSWQQSPESYAPDILERVFSSAAEACPESLAEEKAALSLMQLQQLVAEEDPTLSAANRQAASATIDRILSNPQHLRSNLYLLLDAGEFLAPLLNSEQQAGFSDLYTRMSEGQSESLFVRIQALRALIGMDTALAVEHRDGVTARIAQLRSEAEQFDRTDPRFHATINAAGNMLVESGQLTEAKELLSAEVSRSKYVYYFMGELADIEQKLGNAEAAIQWRRQAFDQARGPATRFQWGVNYLRTLLELDADNMAAVRSGFAEVFAELAATKAMYQRSRTRLESLDQHLRDWAGKDESRLLTLAEFRNTAQTHCKTLPASEQAKNYCESFLHTGES